MYTIFMIIAVPVLAIGWVAYAMWIRKVEEEEFEGPAEEFLSSLNMKFVIHEAREEDLKRAEELTVRTNLGSLEVSRA